MYLLSTTRFLSSIHVQSHQLWHKSQCKYNKCQVLNAYLFGVYLFLRGWVGDLVMAGYVSMRSALKQGKCSVKNENHWQRCPSARIMAWTRKRTYRRAVLLQSDDAAHEINQPQNPRHNSFPAYRQLSSMAGAWCVRPGLSYSLMQGKEGIQSWFSASIVPQIKRESLLPIVAHVTCQRGPDVIFTWPLISWAVGQWRSVIYHIFLLVMTAKRVVF